MALTGQEQFIKNLVWPEDGNYHEIHWLPREQTFIIHKGEEVDENLLEVQRLSQKVDSLTAAIARIEAGLKENAGTSTAALNLSRKQSLISI